MGFGQYLKKVREQKGLSSRELARRSGVSQPYLSQLETGKNNNPTNDVIKKIAIGLEVNYLELLHKAGYIDKKTLDLNKDLHDPTLDANLAKSEIVYHLDKILNGDHIVEYNKRHITANEKEGIIKFIDNFIVNDSKKGDQ